MSEELTTKSEEQKLPPEPVWECSDCKQEVLHSEIEVHSHICPAKPIDVIKEMPNKADANRQPNGTFGPGNRANPAGRPKGKSLKEYDREKFAKMTEEEKEAFLQKISPELRYRMAEGNPTQGLVGGEDGEGGFAPFKIEIVTSKDQIKTDENNSGD